MRLTEARIKNFKGIEECTLKFQPGFNLLKGENGTGKTSVLDALALGLGAFVGWGIPGYIPKFFTDIIRKQYLRQGDGSGAMKYLLPSEVSLTAFFSESMQAITWVQSQDMIPDKGGSRGKLDSEEIVTLSKKMVNDTEKKIPVLCYQGVPNARMDHAGVLMGVLSDRIDILTELVHIYHRQEKSSPTITIERMVGYLNALFSLFETTSTLEWCNRMERIQLQKGKAIAEYEAVKRAVSFFMSTMEPYTKYRVFYDNQLSTLMCEAENRVTLPLSDFSAGYQSLIWMVLDIARRMAELNPFLLDKITDTPGVVLIDELDLHLHPKWQWRVIDALRTTFPNVQFIAATHAPILFASANDVWIVNLEDGKEPSYQWSQYGLDIGTAVSEYQGDYTLPERVQKMAFAVSDALNREDYPEAKAKLEELEREVAPKPGENGGSAFLGDPPLLTELRARYDIESSWPEE